MKSINNNGTSVCLKGKENYTTFTTELSGLKKATSYQYDYRHTDDELYSTVAPTLEKCRADWNS